MRSYYCVSSVRDNSDGSYNFRNFDYFSSFIEVVFENKIFLFIVAD